MRLYLALPLWLLACDGVEPADGRFAAQDALPLPDAADAATVADAGTVDDHLDSPEGQWVMFTEDRKCLGALGTKVENIIWSWYLVDMAEDTNAIGDERRLKTRVRLCHQWLSPLIAGLETVVPRDIPERLPTHELDGVLSGSDAGASLLLADYLDLWGAEGVSPDEPVPTDAADPRVVDQDEDGEPGVSFLVANARGETLCEVRVVQRTHYRFAGQLTHSARIEGGLLSTVDKAILATTSPLCASTNTMVPSPTPSRFVLLRADGREGGLNVDLDQDGQVTCAEVIDAADVLETAGEVGLKAPNDAVCRP